jgi:hypothetical protein
MLRRRRRAKKTAVSVRRFLSEPAARQIKEGSVAVRPIDLTAQIKAEQALMEQRAEQRRREDELQEKKTREMTARQASAYGTVVIAAAQTRFDVDQLAGLLAEAIERAAADHRLPEVWRERGRAFFRGPAPATRRARSAEQHLAGDGTPGPRRDRVAGKGNGHANGQSGGNGGVAARPEPEGDAVPRTADLLSSLAPDRPGPEPAPEA